MEVRRREEELLLEPLVSDLPDYSGLAPMPGNATVLLQRPRKRNVGYQLCESTGRVTVMSLTWALVPGTT